MVMVIYGNLVKVRTHTLSNGDNDRGGVKIKIEGCIE